MDLKPIFDAAWHRRARAGDPTAVALLADVAVGPLYAFCLYRVGRDRHVCEEVVQETLVRAIGQLGSYDPARAGGQIFGWLTGIARNEIRRALARGRGVGVAASLDALWDRIDRELLAVYARLDDGAFGDELLARTETRQMVNATMSQLPPHYQAALEAKYVRGQSVREMASAGRVSEKAIESQLTRARDAFRATFLLLTRNFEAGA